MFDLCNPKNYYNFSLRFLKLKIFVDGDSRHSVAMDDSDSSHTGNAPISSNSSSNYNNNNLGSSAKTVDDSGGGVSDSGGLGGGGSALRLAGGSRSSVGGSGGNGGESEGVSETTGFSVSPRPSSGISSSPHSARGSGEMTKENRSSKGLAMNPVPRSFRNEPRVNWDTLHKQFEEGTDGTDMSLSKN
eukprot:Phypoly_transcript_11297.p1 GENE.Phypoly_transcript_11297~~Phypoly_transcript_11297.p1  ORF type:complete len:188 (-),score=28.99 Phypoly_transcript_11297:651-1214(-)